MRLLRSIALFVFALAVFYGCKTVQPHKTTTLPPLPPAITNKAPRAKITIQPPPYRDVTNLIHYPADAASCIWAVQQSPDLVHWHFLLTNLHGAPAGFLIITNIGQAGFTRIITQTNWL